MKESETPELPKMKSYNEWGGLLPVRLADVFRKAHGSPRVSFFLNKFFIGSWIMYKNSDGGISYAVATTDLDFMDNNYNSVNLPQETTARFVPYSGLNNIENAQDILTDFMINPYVFIHLPIGYRDLDVTIYFNDEQTLWCHWGSKHERLKKLTLNNIYGYENAFFDFAQVLSKGIFDVHIKEGDKRFISSFKSNGDKISGLRTSTEKVNEAKILDFGKAKDEKTKQQTQDRAMEISQKNTQYRWLITHNEPASNELTIVGYYPQKIWLADKNLDVKTNAKNYLGKMSKNYKTEGGLIMWKLENRHEEIERYFNEKEIVDVAEVDSTYSSGEYVPYAIKYINSKLRLVHY